MPGKPASCDSNSKGIWDTGTGNDRHKKMGMGKPYTTIKTELNNFKKSYGESFDWIENVPKKVQGDCILPSPAQ